MREILLAAVVLLFFVLGLPLMKKLDRFLSGKAKAGWEAPAQHERHGEKPGVLKRLLSPGSHRDLRHCFHH